MDARQPALHPPASDPAISLSTTLLDFPTIQGASPPSALVRGRARAPAQGRAAAARARPRGEMQLHVTRLLRSALMAGQFVPGQTLSLRQLAQQLGTSPMPVRGALTQLIASGVLEIQPSGSVAVAGMTEARFAELTGVRKALEGMAAAMACRNATPKLIATLERINTRLQRSIARRDVLACLRLNQAFHFALYSASHSEILPAMIESLWLRAGPFMYFSLAAPATLWDASGHQAVIRALRAGDARGTRIAIERDIASSADYLLRRSAAFRQHGATPTAGAAAAVAAAAAAKPRTRRSPVRARRR
jgi:DNA-binding GntR family transcriptional regulator